MFYGQKLQMMMYLNDISRSLKRVQVMKENSRKESVDYLKNLNKDITNPQEKIDPILEYFTILPVDMDPSGVMKKLEHVLNTRDDRMKNEIKSLAPSATSVQHSSLENIVEVATALNFVYKVIRHFYILGKKTSSFMLIVQLQAMLPMILQEAEALSNAVNALKLSQPLGDGIGAMVAGKFMVGKEKKTIARETVLSESEYKERILYLMKAEGPGGYVGQPGTALTRVFDEMGTKIDTIIMIDAALKLEGEKSGEIAEGIGAAIGGMGVDRFKIEEVALKHNTPLYAIVIKQSIQEAISTMKKEIAESIDKVIPILYRIIEEKTKSGDSVLIIGVGNTLGVAQ
jgi:hypothetical protein